MIDDDPADDDLDADPDAAAFLREVARIDDAPALTGDDLYPGARLGRFRIVAKLGTGSMGAVYEARDEGLDRTVAIKVMRRATTEARSRFLREARAAAAVAHANLVTVHEVGEADGRAYIVMERIRGRTLRAEIEARPGPARVRAIALDIARGLAAIHAAGVVHRDLKPDNVMLDDDGRAVVLDFGIARLGTDRLTAAGGTDERAPAMTGTGVVVGTPSYMSPEQARGDAVDERSDVYSLGILLSELRDGVRPATGAPGPSVTANVDRADRELDAVIARCLAPRPSERPGAAEIVELLARPPARQRRRGRTFVLAVAGAIITAAAVAILVWRLARDGHHETQRIAAVPGVVAASPDALAAYRGALQSLHDGLFFDAVRGLEHAVELDPHLAAAQLRLGLAKRFFHSHEEGRRAFAIAVRDREQLDARDRALLDAAEPSVMRSPYDYAESKRRYLAALDRFPDDSELTYWLAYTYSELGEHRALLPVLDRMLAIDPTVTAAAAGKVLTLLYLGDRAGAREAAIECRRIAPTPGSCAFELIKVLDDTGACDELETVLRAWALASPDESRAPHLLAELLLVQDRPRAAVSELLAQAMQRVPASDRADVAAEDALLIAMHDGDFTTAERLVRDQDHAIAGIADEGAHGNIAIALADLATETGRPGDAAAIATDFAQRRTGWDPVRGTSDGDLFNDRRGDLLAAQVHGGAITEDERAARRDAWVRELEAEAGGAYRSAIWAHAYAASVTTPAEAAAALAEIPRFAPLPTFYWFPRAYGAVGRTYALAGAPADALPYLTRATSRCLARDPRDSLALGEASAALAAASTAAAPDRASHRAAACAAYAAVERRWGHSVPRSVTAEAARSHAGALRCGSLR